MGCDIHLFTEQKRHINDEEKWICADHFKLNPYHKEGGDEGKYSVVSLVGRNYGLFSMLADVRNHGENPNPFMEPKGFPDDANDLVKEEKEAWDGDGHSHSWLTMKELYDFLEANPIQKYSGFVDEEGAAAIDKGEMPEWWCGSSNVKTMVYREWEHENDTMKWFIETLEKHFDQGSYYNKERDAEKCRIVFWFDN